MKITRTMLTALASVVMLAAGPIAASAQEFILKVSAANAPNEKDPIYAWMLAFEKGVEERSENRIDVQLYPSNQLGQQPAAIEGAAMGTIETTIAIVGLFASIDPRFQVLDSGGLFDSPEHAMRGLQQPPVREMLSEFGQDAGVQVLTILIDGQGVIVAKEPIETVADFQGRKIRSGGATPLLNEPLKALGAAPVSLPLGEVVPSLQTGTIDAATSSMAIVNAFQMADVAENVTYIPGNFTAVGSVINTAFLDSVGPEMAAVIKEVAQEAESVVDEHLARRPEQEAQLEATGGRVIRLSDEEEAKYLEIVEPVVAEVVAQSSQMQSDYEVLKAASEATR